MGERIVTPVTYALSQTRYLHDWVLTSILMMYIILIAGSSKELEGCLVSAEADRLFWSSSRRVPPVEFGQNWGGCILEAMKLPRQAGEFPEAEGVEPEGS